MTHCTDLFPRYRSLVLLIFVIAVAALPTVAQNRSDEAAFVKVSLKTTKACTVAPTGEVTSLVKNGVELSVTEDFDCDGIPDAYDNCIGIQNADQADTDRNGIGDACEAATIIKPETPAKNRSTVRPKEPAKNRSKAKAKEPTKNRSDKKARDRKAAASDKRGRRRR